MGLLSSSTRCLKHWNLKLPRHGRIQFEGERPDSDHARLHDVVFIRNRKKYTYREYCNN